MSRDMDRNPRTILAEFEKEASGRFTLFSVNVFEDCGDYFLKTTYDVDRSKKYGYLYDQSGSGGGREAVVRGIYFVDGPVPVKVIEKPTALVSGDDRPPWRSPKTIAIRERNRTRRLSMLPKEFRGDGDILDWLRANAIEQDGVWCCACRDWVPGDDLCQHSWWCDSTHWYSTPDDRKTCSLCINGRCREAFEMAPHVQPFDDGPLWFWSGNPQLHWSAR